MAAGPRARGTSVVPCFHDTGRHLREAGVGRPTMRQYGPRSVAPAAPLSMAAITPRAGMMLRCGPTAARTGGRALGNNRRRGDTAPADRSRPVDDRVGKREQQAIFSMAFGDGPMRCMTPQSRSIGCRGRSSGFYMIYRLGGVLVDARPSRNCASTKLVLVLAWGG
jgi:hypothetical protein